MRLVSLLLSAAILTLPAVADASSSRRFDIPAGRLGDALVLLGRQGGVSIGVIDQELASRRVGPLRGNLTVQQALRRLLDDCGARYLAVDRNTYRIVRAPAPRRPRPQPRRPAPLPSQLPPVEMDETDIVITATKRSLRFANFAGSVSYVDGNDAILAGQGRSTEGLVARMPGLNSTHLGSGRNKLFLRGIADSSFNGPTQATVGQYLGETRLNYNTPDPNLRLHDVARIEVLPGPQGTLYGAGSLGGIMRVVPNAPDSGSFYGSVMAGLSATQHGEPGGELAGVLNLPIAADAVGLRLVGYGLREGGYIDDTQRGLEDVNRTHIYGGRARLRVEAGGWTIDLGAAGQHIRGDDGQFADRDAEEELTRASPIAEDYSNDYLLADLSVEREWGEGLRFVSTAGVVRQELDERYDSTRGGATPVAYDQSNRLTLLSTESRLSRTSPDGTGWLVGTSFISNTSSLRRALGDPEAPTPITGVRNTVDEITVFGEGTVRLGPNVNASMGGRLTHSRLSGMPLDATAFASPISFATLKAKRDETVFLPSFALSYRPRPDLLLFARYQEGFRPGGLAVVSPFIGRVTVGGSLVTDVPVDVGFRLASIGRYENDNVATVEAGLRYGRPRAGTFDLAASVAYTRWTNIQADVIDLFGFQTTSNIGDGRIYTLDLRVGWRPLPGLNIEAATVLNDSLVTNPYPSVIITPDSPLPNVARVNAFLGADYRTSLGHDVDLTLWGSARYAGRSTLGIGPILGEEQGDWLDIGAGARLERGRHAFTLGVTNLTDAVGNRFAMGSPFTLPLQRQITPLRPRTLRAGWELRF